jgi:hypothetical protein
MGPPYTHSRRAAHAHSTKQARRPCTHTRQQRSAAAHNKSPSPLKWLLNGSSRATPGLGVPLNEPDRDHDERTRYHRFSRAPQRGHHRPPVGPDVMAPLRGPGTAAPKRRPGTAGAIDEALTAIDKGFRRHGPRRYLKYIFEAKASFGITGLYHDVQPPASGLGSSVGVPSTTDPLIH